MALRLGTFAGCALFNRSLVCCEMLRAAPTSVKRHAPPEPAMYTRYGVTAEADVQHGVAWLAAVREADAETPKVLPLGRTGPFISR